MRTIFTFILFASFGISCYSQTTAMDFNSNDCNGNPVHLFADLDAGKAVVLYYYMPNCSTCPPPANAIQKMANKINATCPGMVKGYANSYLNSTTCAYTASWVTSNNLNFYTPMGGTGADEVAYYGGFGMPTVVLVGGTNHEVLWSTQSWQNSDTTTMRDLILAMNCSASVDETDLGHTLMNIYPNPTSNQAEITFALSKPVGYTLKMYNMAGQIVYSTLKEATEQGIITEMIDVDGFEEGIYQIELNINGIVTTQRLAIQH